MICAYCGKEKSSTKEHIISSGIMDLFPECYLTFDSIRKKQYKSDPIVKDVCADCNNNKLSYIDSYAKDFISKYFVDKYRHDSMFEIEYDYTLVQKMLLKFTYNDSRAQKYDISYFDETVIDFLLDKEKNDSLNNVTIMAGLAVNYSPLHESVLGNTKIRWNKEPCFLENSLIKMYDYETGLIKLREDGKRQTFESLSCSYIFRFNSLQIIILCWDKNISEETLHTNNMILEHIYPYAVLNDSGISTLSRCTSFLNFHTESIVDVNWGQGLADEIANLMGLFSKDSLIKINQFDTQWKDIESKIASENVRN